MTTNSAGTPARTLKASITEGAPPQRIADLLDGLTHSQRVAAVRSLGRGAQRRLWQIVEGFGSLDFEDFVPADIPLLTPVRHYGRNSLPAFQIFEKRFYRMGDGSQVGGANFQTIQPVTGPGYFVLTRDDSRGEVVVDYRQVPSEKPEGWPRIRSNEQGLSRFIYGFTTDTMRRVSEHVTIGSAARHGEPLGAWFVLCREESKT